MMKSQIWIEKKLEPQTERKHLLLNNKKKRKKRKQEKINEDPIYK